MVIKNQFMSVEFDEKSGGVLSLVCCDDADKMNWVEGKHIWGTPAMLTIPLHTSADNTQKFAEYTVDSVEFDGSVMECVYSNGILKVKAKRYFTEKGAYREEYTLVNETKTEVFVPNGNFGIYTTFNDNYQDVQTCLTGRCHTHFWLAGASSCINGVKMSAKAPHIALVLTEGTLSSYSVERDTLNSSNDRGDFIVHPFEFVLSPNEEYRLSWEIFFHGGDDLFDRLKQYDTFINIHAENYTLFPNEPLKFTAEASKDICSAKVDINGKELDFKVNGNILSVDTALEFSGERTESVVNVEINGVKTYLKILQMNDFDNIMYKRTKFIQEKQQYFKKGSHLDGAYLIYDRQTDSVYYSGSFADHNAGRERVAMGVIIACQLQKKMDKAMFDSLLKYVEFVERELFDFESGVVYNDAPRNNEWHRNYNYPWVATLFIEMFKLTGDKTYLEKMFSCMRGYYNNNGEKFYAIGIPMEESVRLLNENGMSDKAGELLNMYIRHGEMLIKNSIHYPAHEVAYEQSIVAPAASMLCQLYEITKEEKYLEEFKKQLPLLCAFEFCQPDFRMNETAIRHWDGYWFGKRMQYGDTYPHYWSTLSGDVMARYARLTGDSELMQKAQKNLRSSLNLFFDDGFGSCAYMNPVRSNGREGKYYDEWANDQDWAIYYQNKWLDYKK